MFGLCTRRLHLNPVWRGAAGSSCFAAQWPSSAFVIKLGPLREETPDIVLLPSPWPLILTQATGAFVLAWCLHLTLHLSELSRIRLLPLQLG